MKWKIYTVGKPALAYAKTGVAEYLKRLQRYTPCEHLIMRKGDAPEIESLLGARKDGVLNIIMDERGKALTTDQFTEKVRTWQLDSVKGVRCFIGGADGHNATIVVLLEQIYRAHTILRGEPYHR
ncbi:MAG: 23S rRNA (pseudouridine(1915)-N(3))-methyltransferase RlmH [Verrucomicrobiales bacterium]